VGFSKKEAAEIVEMVFDTIKETLERGEKIKISGFGTSSSGTRSPAWGAIRRPARRIEISARRVLTFRPSQVLKNALNLSAEAPKRARRRARRRSRSAAQNAERRRRSDAISGAWRRSTTSTSADAPRRRVPLRGGPPASPVRGPCFRLHGHNYKFFVAVEGEVDPKTGMIADFGDIKRTVQEHVLARVDHRDLNDFLENPTAENIAR